MRILSTMLFVALLCSCSVAQKSVKDNNNKKSVIEHVERNYEQLTQLSDKIWSYEEIAFKETQSSAALAEYARNNGFKVTEGVGEIPTALVAEYGSGKPIIGILGEFDALPGLSQKTVPEKAPLHEGAPGHGCGHNLFGVASLGAAVAIKDLIAAGKLKGTVRFYGTPAEEK